MKMHHKCHSAFNPIPITHVLIPRPSPKDKSLCTPQMRRGREKPVSSCRVSYPASAPKVTSAVPRAGPIYEWHKDLLWGLGRGFAAGAGYYYMCITAAGCIHILLC